MGWYRVSIAAAILAAVVTACSSKSTPPPSSDASTLDDGGASDFDSGLTDAQAGTGLHDGGVHGASSHGGSTDATTPTSETCGPEPFPKWDGSFGDASCGLPGQDSDDDGYPDCVDGCPNDPDKIAPGVCGCGISDQDSDGDGVPDCLDGCPLDPNNTSDYSQCGCVGEGTLQPQGTACTDTGCPQANAVCNGAGVCGDRSACSPCAGGRLVVTKDDSTQFWFCGIPVPALQGADCGVEGPGALAAADTRAAAQSACAAKGIALARIETLSTDRDIAPLLAASTWIGANDLATPGEWYWSSATSESGSLFWSGGIDGSQQNSEFYNWAAGAPGSQSCAVMTTDNLWQDTACTQTLGYLCSYDPPLL
jgi:hypothetical protein